MVKQYGIRIIKYLVVLLVGMGIGILLKYGHQPKTNTIVKEVPKTEIKTQTVTRVQYVPKTSKTDSDVEIVNKNPTVSVNGKQYQFQKLPTESNKFEDGKVTVTQGYDIKIDAKDLIPKQPKWGLDVGYSNHGYTIGVRHNFNRNVSVSVMGTPVQKDGKDRFYGGALTINF